MRSHRARLLAPEGLGVLMLCGALQLCRVGSCVRNADTFQPLFGKIETSVVDHNDAQRRR